MNGWEITKNQGKPGTGNWNGFNVELDLIFDAAYAWEKQLDGLEKGWLCWSIQNEWCLVQQKIIKDIGWVPIVGWDPNCVKKPSVIPEAILVDFNYKLKLPVLWSHVPLEFSYLWIDKLAFWHGDLLLTPQKMKKYSSLFNDLRDGEIAAVKSKGGIRHFFNYKKHRYWELLGCTTKKASKMQYDLGCGWWRNFHLHPNCPSEIERKKRASFYYDSGVGVMYWKRRYNGNVFDIKESDISMGHFSVINYKNLYRESENKRKELELNFSLSEACMELGISQFYESS